MDVSPHVSLTIAIALAAGMIVQCAARSLRMPAIILLLGAGVLLGPEQLDWVRPSDLGSGLFILVDFAVAIILFEGGLNLKIERLRREQRVINQLITWGALVTLTGGTLAARWWLGWPWTTAALFGALVVVTGPTVVTPLVRDIRLRPRIQTILEAEGVLIDPIGALLAALVLQVTLSSGAHGVVSGIGMLGLRIAAGVVFGAIGGLAIAGTLRIPAVVRGFENALTLALVVLIFHASEAAIAPSGLLAVTVAGLVVGNLKSPVDDDLREFKDQLTVLMVGAVFILLAADVTLTDVWALGWRGTAILATLMLFVRPAAVWIASRGSDLSARERIFLAATAPRGIVAAAIASLAAEVVIAGGGTEGHELRALVFLVIAGTVITAGIVARPLASALGLRLPTRDRVAILGAQGLGLALARELTAAGQIVTLIDADPQRCRAAEAAGLSVIFGDALADRTLRRIPIEHVGTAVGVTFNDHLNSQFVALACGTFGVKKGLVSVEALDGERLPQHVSRHGADVLFDGAHDQERWDVRWRQGDVEVVRASWSEPAAPREIEENPAGPAAPPVRPPADVAVVLTIDRKGQVSPMALSEKRRAGDVAAIAVYRRDRDAAVEGLAASGWTVIEDTAASAAAVATPG